MRCCGREATSFELKVKGEPYVLYRCPGCQRSHWVHDEDRVSVDRLTDALRAETLERAERRSARRQGG